MKEAEAFVRSPASTAFRQYPWSSRCMTRNRYSRRDVLRGLGGLALGPAIRSGRTPRPVACPTSAISAVPNRARAVQGLEAYAEKSVAAGDTIHFRISSPYGIDPRLSIVRLGWDTELRTRDWTLSSVVLPDPGPQAIRPGSYVHVESALDSFAHLAAFTVESWVRPFRGAGNYARQGIVTQCTEYDRCGFALGIDAAGRPTAYFGDGSWFRPEWQRTAPAALARLQWHHVAATFDAGNVALWVDGVLVDQGFLPGLHAFTPGLAPLRIGASGSASGTDFFLDGDVAMPAIHGRALAPEEIAARARRSSPPRVPTGRSLFGCWPLAEERGSIVADASACDRTGVVVHHGTWMIGGPSFDASSVPEGYDPDADPLRGHGLRLSGSDLFDCAWPITHTATIPEDAPPGIYAGRIEWGEGGRYDVTFVVRRAPLRPPAPIVVLCATNTWHAYNKSFDLFGFYDAHAGSQPPYYQGLEMPWSNPVPYGQARSDADPYVTYTTTPGYSHLVRAERFLHVWLEQNGYDFDVLTDRELHETPDALAPYRVLFVAGHSEYWTREAQARVKDWVTAGGRLVVASGNTMFWRVSLEGGVLECRKSNPSVGGFADAKPGELFHEHDHDLGGLLRRTGSPGWEVTGLESTGFDGTHVPFEVTGWTHPFFQAPEAIDVAPDESGTPATIGGAVAVGHEWDASLSQIPGHPAGGPDVAVLAQGRGDGSQLLFDYRLNAVPSAGAVISEIVEFPSGAGGVFSAGSIATGQSLHADPKMAALFRNVLHHFGVAFRLHATAIGADGRAADLEYDGERWGALDFGQEGFGGHPPTGLQLGPGRIASFCVAASGALLGRFGRASGFDPWSDLSSGGTFQGRPAAIAWGRDRLLVIARDPGGRLLQKTWAPAPFGESGWSEWSDASGTFSSDASAAVWAGSRATVAALDASGRVLCRDLESGAWRSAWRSFGGGFAFAPTLFAWGGDRLSLFAVDANGRLFARTRIGGTWTPPRDGWLDLGAPASGLAGRVHAAFAGHDQTTGADTFFVLGVGADGRLKSKQWDGVRWLPSTTGWNDLGGELVGEPAVASYRGRRLCVLAAGADAQLWRAGFDGTSWSSWQGLGGSIVGSPAIFTSVASS